LEFGEHPTLLGTQLKRGLFVGGGLLRVRKVVVYQHSFSLFFEHS
jgi:hypothetical protein